MQRRRREGGHKVQVPIEFWKDLKASDVERVCENALGKYYPPTGLLLLFMGEYLMVDLDRRRLCRQSQGHWEPIDNPLLELVCLVYLLNAGPQTIKEEMVSVKELKTAHFFTGPHELRIEPLLNRYGNDSQAFKKAAERLGGEALDLADVSYRFPALPKVPLYYLLWKGDEEFKPRLSILFDRSIEDHLAADAIWGLANLVSDLLLSASFRS